MGLQRNLAGEAREFDELKNRVTLQAANRLPADGSIEEIGLLEYGKYFRNKLMLQQHPKVTVMLLGQFLKKLLAMEGLKDSSDDDLFRPVHAKTRQKIAQVIGSRKEVMNAVRIIQDTQLDDLPIEKIVGYFSFRVKSGLAITDAEVAKVAQAFKAAAMRETSKDLLSSTAIFAKVAAKLVIHDSPDRREALQGVFKSTVEPIMEQYMDDMSFAEASMTLKSLVAVTGFKSLALPNRVMKAQLKNLPQASHQELASIMDVALELNLSSKGKGSGLMDEEPSEIIRALLSQINGRLRV